MSLKTSSSCHSDSFTSFETCKTMKGSVKYAFIKFYYTLQFLYIRLLFKYFICNILSVSIYNKGKSIYNNVVKTVQLDVWMFNVC